MFVSLFSSAIHGVDAYIVRVEVDASNGLPGCTIVGLPDPAVREATERVRSALKNSGFEFPTKRLTVNLAPANTRKEGPGFDLAIALGILAASGQVEMDPSARGHVLMGELSLDGRVMGVRGVLAAAIAAREAGMTGIVAPAANAGEAMCVGGVQVFAAKDLRSVAAHMLRDPGETRGKPGALESTDARDRLDCAGAPNVLDTPGARGMPGALKSLEEAAGPSNARWHEDLLDVVGQEAAKRALEIAAAGGHNVLLIGPPGSGKTMLARRLRWILPPLAEDESLEVTKVYSVCGLLPPGSGLIRERPFRAPHHTISYSALVGGGMVDPKPGEVTLAHHGVLFLDEATEFRRDALEALRQPVEEGYVRVVRSGGAVSFPARVVLVLSSNPCPCGFLGDPVRPCTCAPGRMESYRNRLSGPLLDRIDLHVEVGRVEFDEGGRSRGGVSSGEVLRRVMSARAFAARRLAATGITCNGLMSHRDVRKVVRLDAEGLELLKRAFDGLGLSMRAHDRILKVARTIADLESSADVGARHIAEAIQYRALDRRPAGASRRYAGSVVGSAVARAAYSRDDRAE